MVLAETRSLSGGFGFLNMLGMITVEINEKTHQGQNLIPVAFQTRIDDLPNLLTRLIEFSEMLQLGLELDQIFVHLRNIMFRVLQLGVKLKIHGSI